MPKDSIHITQARKELQQNDRLQLMSSTEDSQNLTSKPLEIASEKTTDSI
jgi:hypothetical protein